MEKFRTIVKFTESPEKLTYSSSIFMLGSCFAESTGNILKQMKFDITLNPFGIIYHPVSVAQSMERLITGKPYIMDDLQQHNELWCSFDHHGRFSAAEPSACLQQINTELQHAHERIIRVKWVFITFGTAWVYRLKSNGRVVANCHKYPACDFERVRLKADEIYHIWMKTIANLRTVNPDVRIVFTVSPIRHLRDGAHDNQLSKSLLLLAVDRLNRELPGTDYFPAYEIMLDDLRDYRFYDDGMVHPNSLAVKYIWKRFCERYMASSALQTMEEVENIVNAARHRPIHYTSACRSFAAAYLEKITQLQQKNPQLDFAEETKLFRDLL